MSEAMVFLLGNHGNVRNSRGKQAIGAQAIEFYCSRNRLAYAYKVMNVKILMTAQISLLQGQFVRLCRKYFIYLKCYRRVATSECKSYLDQNDIV